MLNPCIDARVAADGTEEMDRSAVPSDAVVTDMVLSALANPSSLGGLRRRHTWLSHLHLRLPWMISWLTVGLDGRVSGVVAAVRDRKSPSEPNSTQAERPPPSVYQTDSLPETGSIHRVPADGDAGGWADIAVVDLAPAFGTHFPCEELQTRESPSDGCTRATSAMSLILETGTLGGIATGHTSEKMVDFPLTVWREWQSR